MVHSMNTILPVVWYKKWSKEGEDQTIRARLAIQISTEKREKLREENGLEKQPND